MSDPLSVARALVLADLTTSGATEPETVSILEEAVAERRGWVAAWPEGATYAAGLVAQDVQDRLLDTRGRWPLCPLCEDATHAVHIQPDLGGPDPTWCARRAAGSSRPWGRSRHDPPEPARFWSMTAGGLASGRPRHVVRRTRRRERPEAGNPAGSDQKPAEGVSRAAAAPEAT